MKALAPAWIFQTGDYENGLQATPIVIDGIIYLSTSNAWVFALDGASGRVIWEYHFTLGKGRQYVATPTGWGSIVADAQKALWPNAPTARPGSALVVFALPEAPQ